MNNHKDHKELLEKLKPLLNNRRQWQHFNNYIDFIVNQQHKILEQSTDIAMLHKAQGAVEALNKIKTLDQIMQGDR